MGKITEIHILAWWNPVLPVTFIVNFCCWFSSLFLSSFIFQFCYYCFAGGSHSLLLFGVNTWDVFCECLHGWKSLFCPQYWVNNLSQYRSEVKSLSRVWFFATPWTVAFQVPPSMGFSRQEYWSGVPFPSPGDLPNPGIEPRSPALQADALPTESHGSFKRLFL